jgi:hypothetical protein
MVMSDAPGTRSYIPPSEEERLKQRIAELEAKALHFEAVAMTAIDENERLREALVEIDDASNHYAMTPTYSEDTLRYAHKSTRNLARAALVEGE